MDPFEEKFYEIAAREVASKATKPGLMAKAFTLVPSDEKRIFAKYIELRVEQLKEEAGTLLEFARQKALEQERVQASQKRQRAEEELVERAWTAHVKALSRPNK